jgi:hypothetical protein
VLSTPLKRPYGNYSAPSWSWASIEGVIMFETEKVLASADIKSISVLLADPENEYGQLISATLTIKGRLLTIPFEPSAWKCFCSIWSMTKPGKPTLDFPWENLRVIWDCGILPQTSKVTFICIFLRESGGISGLVLVLGSLTDQSDDASPSFTRVGYWYLDASNKRLDLVLLALPTGEARIV